MKLIHPLCIIFQMLSDFLYRAPTDKIVKLLVDQHVPVYIYVLNTTVEALKYPEWRKYPHDIEYFFLTGAPFMDVGSYIFSLVPLILFYKIVYFCYGNFAF